MSLYYEAAPLLLTEQAPPGSLKSRVFSFKTFKSPPKQVYALVSEASKWSPVLAEVIENSQLLQLERKLTPNIALLLVHDLLLTKRGISAPSSHPLRLAAERHKARLNAELTKSRLRKGCASIEDLRAKVEKGDHVEKRTKDGSVKTKAVNNISTPNQWPQPRWVRVNTIKTSIDEQLRTTFAGYTTVDLLEALSSSNIEKLVHIDKHVPNLLALPPFTDLTKTSAYINGQIILQDKASCFPAFLLDPKAEDGDCLDACAAPGNKTTHLASIIHNQGPSNPNPTIFACERDNYRAQTLLEMIQKSGATSYVTVKPGHDFLRIDPTKSPWDSIGTLLVDPSCSGSGIVDRDKVLKVVLPSKEPVNLCQAKSKKRKRNPAVRPDQTSLEVPVEILTNENMLSDQLSNRLTALSTFQLKLLLHAFQFPKALKITYSTCSIYAQENEHVVMKALSSAVAKQRGWQILNRQDQVPGMRSWIIRGNAEWCREVGSAEDRGYADIAEACIRCEKGTRVGTQGFFVAAFVRDPKKPGIDVSMDLEWEGFSEGSVA